MGINSQALSRPGTSEAAAQSFCFGRLHYNLHPHDVWGWRMADNLTRALRPATTAANQARTIHLIRHTVAPLKESAGALPAPLNRYLPAERGPWLEVRNRTGRSWHSRSTPDAVWTDGAAPSLGGFSFELPWNLLLADIAALGGGVMHGGLAVHAGHGLLLLAPPGGGKTTTLATAPAEWAALSDDAALVWPEAGTWLASPLPSWTLMTGAKPMKDPFDPAPQIPLRALVILVKGEGLNVSATRPIEAAAAIYRGLTEYPAVVFSELPLAQQLFRTACALARTLPCWRLDLPLGGNCWPLLARALASIP